VVDGVEKGHGERLVGPAEIGCQGCQVAAGPFLRGFSVFLRCFSVFLRCFGGGLGVIAVILDVIWVILDVIRGFFFWGVIGG
jgi:hypothetical protein